MSKPERSPPISTVWLDLTPLVEAPTTRITGIPRTVTRIFHHWLADQYTDLRFCTLDEASQSFCEVNIQAVLARFPRSTDPPAVEPQQAMQVVRVTSSAPSWSLRFRRLGRWLPHAIRRRLVLGGKICQSMVRFAQGIFRAAVTQAVGMFRASTPDDPGIYFCKRMLQWAIKKKRALMRRPPPRLALGPSDLVISLGAGWLVPNSHGICWRLKQEQGFRLVMLMYDIIPLLFPQFYGPKFPASFDWWTADSIWSSDLLLAISEHTRRDVEAHCHQRLIPCPPVEVIRLGDDLAGGDVSDRPPTEGGFRSDRPFVLTVGTVEVRKNHLALYHVWRQLVQQRGADVPQLVIVGGRGWLVGDLLFQIENDPLTAGHVILLNNLDDRELLWLYRNCLFTLYPSHYEGWGLPIAESLGHGKYCIASSTSSMPEVGGDLVGQHEPTDLHGCLRLVEQALDPAFRALREQIIRERFRLTSWAACADQLADCLRTHFGPVLSRKTDQERSDESVAA